VLDLRRDYHRKEVFMPIPKGPLYAALTKLKHATDPRPSLPILSCAHLHAHHDQLVITATDLTTWLRTTIPCSGDLQACIPIKPLLDFIKPKGRKDAETEVEIELVEDHHVQVVLPGAKTTIDTLPVRDFPVHPAGKVTEWKPDGSWDTPTFQDALSWVLPATSKDPTRPHLSGIYFDNEAVVATDGHRLHLSRLEGMDSGPTLVPAKAISSLIKILPGHDHIQVHRADDLLRFTVGSWELTTKVMTEKFPPYGMVIPSVSYEAFHTIIESARLTEALKQLPRLPPGRAQGVTLRINGQMYLERETDQGKASVAVEPVDSTHRGDDFEVGLDGRYLIDALAAGEELCTIRFGGSLDPVRIEPGEKLAVLMPLRI
jgi:DNA polymerase III sliding clamp (beta) subunit (PCNA family)